MKDSFDRQGPTLAEDVAQLSAIGLSAFVALVATEAILMFAAYSPDVRIQMEALTVDAVAEAPAPQPVLDERAGADRLFASVKIRDGRTLVGYIRWNRQEASWTDLVPGEAVGSNALAGVRFGNVRRIDPIGGATLRLELKNGDVVERAALGPNGSPEVAWLSVETAAQDTELFALPEVESVLFLDEPADLAPLHDRLHGTVTTRDGLFFTGYLRLGADGFMAATTFADLGASPLNPPAQLARVGTTGALLRDASGSTVRMAPSAAPDRVGVSDPGLGSVEIPWERVRDVRFHEPVEPMAYSDFDGGHPIFGSIITETGTEVVGTMRWDLDESNSWEMLDGHHEGLDFHIEFSQVARVQKVWLGSTVELVDGRSFYLIASNDVNHYNKGIAVESAAGTTVVSWNNFAEMRSRPRH